MNNKQLSPIFLIFLATTQLIGQANLRPSKQYSAGEEIYGAKSGAKSVVPQNWSGVLPRDSELFLFLPMDGSNGEIYISVDQGIDESQRKSNWRTGLDLGNGNVLRLQGEVFKRGESMAANIGLDQKTSTAVGYIESRCGSFGICLTATLFSSPQDFEKNKNALIEFMDALTWTEPNLKADYADFDWHEFLEGKHLLNYDYVPNAKAENDIWLCPDGNFTTKLKRSGLLKDQAKDYKGTKKGTWETKSIGQTGLLILNYEKLSPLKVSLKIAEDRIYLNEKRHFAMKATTCQ